MVVIDLMKTDLSCWFITWPHVNIWLKGRVTLWSVASYSKPPPCHRLFGNGDIMFFICHVTSRLWGWWPHIISYHHVKSKKPASVVDLKIYRSSFVTWSHVTTWSKSHATFVWYSLIINHYLVKFGGYRFLGSRH